MNLLIDIDGIISARAVADPNGAVITLNSPSGFTSEKSYYPAECISITSVEGVLALRDVCNAAIEAHDQMKGAE